MKKQVWIVDDDREIRRSMRQMFGFLGYEQREFSDARSVSRALLAGEIPDLLFIDINMPQVSGMELLEFIRSRSAWNNLPLLMISSESSEVSVEQAIRIGADGYVFKPVSLEELETAVQTAIQRRRILAQ